MAAAQPGWCPRTDLCSLQHLTLVENLHGVDALGALHPDHSDLQRGRVTNFSGRNKGQHTSQNWSEGFFALRSGKRLVKGSLLYR